MKDLNDKKCLVTGAASGIGRATAIAASQHGARLFLTDRDAARLEETAGMIRESGGTVSCHRALDIASHGEVADFAAAIHREFGPMDIVMNIAGISIWGSVEDLRCDHWKRVIDVNLMGPVHVIECFVPAMIAAGSGGHLVNVSSAAGLLALPLHAAYSASKFGLRGLSEVLRYDLRRSGIGVSVICPGAVETPLKQTVEILGINREHAEARKLMKRFSDRAITPERVASMIITAIRKNRYLVITSPDIRAAYWLKRKFFPLYHLIMRRLNAMKDRLMDFEGAYKPDRR